MRQYDERSLLVSRRANRLHKCYRDQCGKRGPHGERDAPRGSAAAAEPPTCEECQPEKKDAVLRDKLHEAVEPRGVPGKVVDDAEVMLVAGDHRCHHKYGPGGCGLPGRGCPAGSARRRISSSCARAAICCANNAVCIP